MSFRTSLGSDESRNTPRICVSVLIELHSVDRTMHQTPVGRNYRMAAVPRMTCLVVYFRHESLADGSF